METHSRAKVKHFLPMRDARDDARVVSRATRDACAQSNDGAKYARCVDIECEMRVEHHA
jgi:hypothetical protein